jgi:hypothetical protein
MSVDPNRPAFPNIDHMGDGPVGLTKREYFAGMAMQGILSNSGLNPAKRGGAAREWLAETSCKVADALITELSK